MDGFVVRERTRVTAPPGSRSRSVPSPRVGSGLPFPPWFRQLAIGLLVLAAFSATWSGIYLAVVQPADLLLLTSLLLLGPMMLFGDLRFPIPRWIWPPMAALLVCATVRSFLPVSDAFFGARYQQADLEPGSVVKSAFWVIALIGVPMAAMACTAIDARVPRWIAAAFVAGVTCSSLVALAALVGLADISDMIGIEDFGSRQTGLTGHPNTLGVVCVIAAPLAVHFLGESRHRWPAIFALLALFAGVVASGSRGAQAAFPVVVVLAVLVSRHRRQILGWLGIAAITGAVVGVVVLEQFAHDTLEQLLRFGATNSTDSDSERLQLARQAINDFVHFPFFGIGVDHISEAHNVYLQLISAGGLVLFLGLAAYWSGMLGACWAARRAGNPLAGALLVSGLGWLVLGAIENQLTDRLLYYTVGCVAAIASARAAESRRRKETETPWLLQ